MQWPWPVLTLGPLSQEAPAHHQASSATPADSKQVQRLQEDLAEVKMQCKRLHEQAAGLQHKNRSLTTSKKELASIVQDMQDYLSKNRP